MCGIAGFLEPRRRRDAPSGEALVRAMARTIAHRGPDGEGVFADPECGIALGHRRLSIIDLSDAGAQPMTSADGRWVIAYNGEIYNFEEMRKELEARNGDRSWRGYSDTEVLLETMATLGFEKALALANGMFAIAAWDRRERALYLARDRMGEKPLYYGWQGETFLFASELKALAVHPDFARRIDADAVALLLRYGYVPSPLCIYRNLAQLRPAHYLKLSAHAKPGALPSPVCYWTLPEPQPEAMDERQATDELDRLLSDAVRLRMRADVPMGAFLSGGIDSSSIVALMQANASSPVRSYSIGFREDAYNEAHFAREVATHIGSTHTEMVVEPKDALDVIPSLPQMYDEPFADSSQIPTFLLSKLTRQHVKVSLSGDGGDELFGGYGRYFDFEQRWARRFPGVGPLRPALASALDAMPPWVWIFMRPFTVHGGKYSPYRVRRAAASIRTRSLQEFYEFLMQQWSANMLARPGPVSRPIFFEQNDIEAFPHPFLGMMYLDAGSYLPDDILVKVDRASMAASLEARVPMLDHRVVEFAGKLPLEFKRNGGNGKWLLRRVLDRYVPHALIDRPKKGFSVPVAAWLRGPLQSWAEELLHDESTIIGAVVDLESVRSVWLEHLSGAADHANRLWAALTLVAWARQWRPL